jgi:Fic-DOC domain mobile mystery protein B
MTEDAITNQPRGSTPIEDISGLIPDITTRSELDEAESLNIVNAIDWVESGRIGDPVTVGFYNHLHRRMYEEVWIWAGKLRTETGDAVKPPFSPPEFVGRDIGRVAMEFNNEWQALEDRTHLIPFVARYHHALVRVHPFNNGNGRWSRLAADAVVQRLADQPPMHWASDAATLVVDSEERSRYIAALRAADKGELQPLVAYLSSLNPGR